MYRTSGSPIVAGRNREGVTMSYATGFQAFPRLFDSQEMLDMDAGIGSGGGGGGGGDRLVGRSSCFVLCTIIVSYCIMVSIVLGNGQTVDLLFFIYLVISFFIDLFV